MSARISSPTLERIPPVKAHSSVKESVENRNNRFKLKFWAKRRKTKRDLNSLIRGKKWKAVWSILFDRNNSNLRDQVLEAGDANGQNCLHLICRFHPPVAIVMKVVDICPPIVNELDSSKRTPLHTAVAWGASINVIDFLLAINPEAASALDCDGMTPLSAGCKNLTTGYLDGGKVPLADSGKAYGNAFVRGPTESVIQSLLDAGPSSAKVADNDNMLPVEYAILGGANGGVVSILQRATAREFEIDAHLREELRIKNLRRCTRDLGRDITLPESTNEACSPRSIEFDKRRRRRKGLVLSPEKSCNETNPENVIGHFNQALNDFLGIDEEGPDCEYDHLSLHVLRQLDCGDAIIAAQNGFRATRQYRLSLEIPTVVDLHDDCSVVSDL